MKQHLTTRQGVGQEPSAVFPATRITTDLLPPIWSRFDLLAGNILVLFWLINAAQAAPGGPVALLYWGLAGLLFYLPSTLATAQLAVLFPGDGSLYTWTYAAFLRATNKRSSSLFAGFLAGACVWSIGPLAVVIGSSAFVSFLQGALPPFWQAVLLSTPWKQGLLMIGLTLLCHLLVTQRQVRCLVLVRLTFWVTCLVVLLVGSAAICWFFAGHSSATSFTQLDGWLPDLQNIGLFGLVCLGYLGVPTTMTMSGEVKGGHVQMRRMLLGPLFWGALLVISGYLLSTWALLVVRGQLVLSTSSNPAYELVLLVQAVWGKGPAVFTAAAQMLFVLISPLLYMIASSRLLLLGGLDRLLPARLGEVNHDRVPVRAFRVGTGFAIGLLLLIYEVAPVVTPLGQPAALTAIVYNVLLSSVTLLFLVGTSFLFVDVWLVWRSKDRHMLISTRVAPLWLLLPSLFAGAVISLFVCCITVRYSVIPQLLSDFWWGVDVLLLFLLCCAVLITCAVIASSEAVSERLLRTRKAPGLTRRGYQLSSQERQEEVHHR